MKILNLTPRIFLILAMILMTPYWETANASDHNPRKHHKQDIVNNAKKGKGISTTTKTGVIDTTKYGQGDYTTTKTKKGNVTTVVKTENFANGTTITSDDIITKNANGSKTSDITTNLGNGKVTVMDETISGKGTITGTYIQSNGKVDEVSGTKDKTSYGYVTDLTLTNVKNQTETIDTEVLKSSDATGWVVTGTSFNGSAINHAGLQTTNTAPHTNTVDTTVNGPGTYAIYQANGTIYNNRTFENNAGSMGVNSITNNPNGTTSYNRMNTSITPTGVQSSSDVQTTYSSKGNGSDSITGTFTQSNGHNGTVAGSDSITIYGYTNNLTYTDQNGLTKSSQTNTLVAGDAILNVNTGTNFNGTSSPSAGLITGENVNYVPLNHPESNQ